MFRTRLAHPFHVKTGPTTLICSIRTLSVVALLLTAMCGQEARADIRYVRITGNDANNGLSAATAYRTIGKAMSVVNPGDIVYVGAGTYSESNPTITRDGTSTNAITFIADSTGTYTGDVGSVILSNGMTASTANYLTLDGFKITGPSTRAFTWSGGTGGIIKNCDVYGLNNGITISNSASVTILDTYIHNVPDDGIDIATSATVRVERCEIAYCNDDGFDVDNSALAIVVDSNIHHQAQNGIDLQTTTGTLTRVVFERCKVQENGDNGVLMGKGGIALRNCLITGNDDHGIFVNNSSGVANVWNSTIADNSLSGINLNNGKIRSQNSIISGNGQHGFRRASGTAYSSYDIYYNNASSAQNGTITTDNMLTGNPQFQTTPTPYMLNTNSPAIDTGLASFTAEFSMDGVDLSTFTKDLAGTSRPVGLHSDIGCYESTTSGPKTYYVATTGNDANSGLSQGLAFRTIGKAGQVVMPGDTVRIASGTYSETPSITSAGTATAPIKFIADTYGQAIVSLPSANAWAVQLSSAHYNEFYGLAFTSQSVTNGPGSSAYGPSVNSSYGVKFESCSFGYSIHGIYAQSSSVHLKNCTIHHTYSYAGQSSSGGLFLEGCTFTNNVNGPYSNQDSYFLAQNCQMTGSTGWAFVMSPVSTPASTYFGTNTPTLQNCSFTAENGVYLIGADNDTRITFTQTTITPTNWELMVQDSTVTITPTWRALWPTEHGRSSTQTKNSTITVSGLTISGYTQGWGLYCDGGVVSVSGSTFTNCQYGAGFNQVSQLSLSNSNFNQNVGTGANGWGLHIWGDSSANISGCQINNNTNGLYCSNVTDNDIQLSSTLINDNTDYGLYANNCQFTFSNNTVGSRWNISGNGYGITTVYGTAVFQNATFSNNRLWAALTYFGDVTVSNCHFTSNGYGGLWSYNNTSAHISDSEFAENTEWGLAVSRSAPGGDAGGAVEVENCQISNNGNSGLYLAYLDDSGLSMSDTEISGNPGSGVYAVQCNLSFNANTVGNKWQFSDNGNNISTYFGTYSFQNITLSGADQWAVATKHSTVTVDNCIFSGNGNGFWSYKDYSFTANNGQFNNNQDWGLSISTGQATVPGPQVVVVPTDAPASDVTVTGSASLTACQIHGNRYGLNAHETNDQQLAVTNTTIQNNSEIGLQCWDSILNFNEQTVGSKWQLSNNKLGIVTMQGTYRFENAVFSGSTSWAVVTNYSDVTVNNATFSNNPEGGFRSNRNTVCTVTGSQFTGNGLYGVAVRADGTTLEFVDDAWVEVPTSGQTSINNSTIASNTQHGLYLEYTDDAHYSSQNTMIQNNPGAGLYTYACDLVFNQANMAKWNLSNNGYNLLAMYGRTRFDGVELSDASKWSVVANYGDVEATDSSFKRSTDGGFWAYGNTTFVADGCNFNNNGTWGLSLTTNLPHSHYDVTTKAWSSVASGTATIQNSYINNNTNGFYAYQTSDSQLTVDNVSIENNSVSGLSTWYGDFTFNSSNVGSKWKIRNNGTNVATNYGTILFDGVTISEAAQWGAVSSFGDVTVRDCTFSGNPTGGFKSYANTSFTAENTRFNGNGSWGLCLYTDGTHQQMVDGALANVAISGPVNLENCEISNNQTSGLLISNSVDSRLSMQGTRIENNGAYGVYAQYSTLSLTADNADRWNLANNLYGIAFAYGTTTISNASLNTNSLSHGLLVYYGTLNANGFTMDGDGSGLYSYLCDNLSVSHSNFQNMEGHGVTLYPKKTGTQTVTLDNVTIDSNVNGLHIINADDGEVAFTNTDVTNNSNYGIHFQNSQVVLDDQPTSRWSASGNGYGLAFTACPDVVVRNATVTQNGVQGVISTGSQVVMEDSQFTGNGGYSSTRDVSVTIDDSRFEGDGGETENWGIANYGSPLVIRNSVLAQFHSGVLVQAYDDTLSLDTHILNCTITSAGSYGVMFDRGRGRLVNSIVTSTNGTQGIVVANQAELTHSHNLVFGFATPFLGTQKGTGEILKNPRFENMQAGNYLLAKGSPAINTGTDLQAEYQLDMLGNTRGSFRKWEIGAYEFMSAAGSLRVQDWREQR